MLEMKSAVSKVLRNFELSLPHDFEPQLVFEIILRPLNGMMLLLNKRKY
jgi:cytochrome P450